jgi:hypothetical protein
MKQRKKAGTDSSLIERMLAAEEESDAGRK